MDGQPGDVSGGENLLIVHWHDLGRYLGVYGHTDVESPRLDRLAAEGILFTRAHATAPLCSPSRGSLFTGRYPQSNGLVGLAHHGWEYRTGVRTLPHLIGEAGWLTALFGMQHETSFPARLGFEEFDVSNSYCDYVVEQRDGVAAQGHQPKVGSSCSPPASSRPIAHTRTTDTNRPIRPRVTVPDHLPDTPEVRQDLADFYGSIAAADAAVGELLDTLDDTGLDRDTWVVFMTDHGPPLPRAKSTLYDAGTGIALIIRPPRARRLRPRVYDELFSGVDLVPTLLEFLGHDVPAEVDGLSHASNLLQYHGQVRSAVYTTKTYHDSFDPIRAVRTKEYSYIENYAQRPLLDLPRDIEESASGRAVSAYIDGPRPKRELYDLVADPAERNNLFIGGKEDESVEAVAQEFALLLNDWRVKTNDVIPSEFAGTRISERYTQTYAQINGLTCPSRSADAGERGMKSEFEQ